MKNREKFNLQFEEHLADEAIVRHLDGELPSKEAEIARRHLESCWTCRARAEAMGEAIARFVEYRDAVYLPSAENPPHSWGTFRSGLARQASEPEVREPLSRRFRALLRPATGYAGLAAVLLLALVWISRPRV